MKKYILALMLAFLSMPAHAVTTQALVPDQGVGDSLDLVAYDTNDHDFVAFARLQSNTTPFFNIYSNTLFNGQTLSQVLAPYATISGMDAAMDAMRNTAPSPLDTLGEIAASMGNDAHFSTTMASDLANKVDKVSGKGLSTEDYTSAEKTKLSGISSGATANSSDATLLNRSNHTGTQAISTVSGLQTALDGKFAIPAGTTSQVVRGDGSLGTMPSGPVNTDALTEGSTNQYFTGARARAAVQCYSGTTQKLGCFPIIKSATVASGVAVFHLTSDGTSTGTALFPNGPDQDSVQLAFNDATASYQPGWAWSNSNKTLTVTVNKLGTANILTGILGQVAASNGFTVKLTVFGN